MRLRNKACPQRIIRSVPSIPQLALLAYQTIVLRSSQCFQVLKKFVDIAGLVKGASEGEGLGNQFLSHIREVDAILEMVRFFDDPDIIHVHGQVSPIDDIEVINLELILVDQQTVAGRLERIAKDARAGVKEAMAENVALEKVRTALDAGKLATTVDC
jgi:ribosome-binding ATPase YchF (GTP1/OBG family)